MPSDCKASVAFSWAELHAELIGKTPRVLLDGACGSAHRQRVLAILGPSGAGKTTLLQALAGRLDRSSKLQLSGVIEPPLLRPAAYIYQEDAFFSRLTVRETLQFALALRAGVTVSVADVLVAMGLAEVATSVVGGGKVRGISGGERKRLAIGCALLAEDMNAPLFADEPTSGLDSFQARRIVEALGKSARGGEGRAVVLSAHQPSARLLECFDDVLLLGANGRTLFLGPCAELVPALERATGGVRPPLLPPAEWALDLASVDPDAVEASNARVARIHARWREAMAAAPTEPMGARQLAPPAAARSPWTTQLTWCFWRSWRQSGGFAAPSLLAMRLIGTLMPGLCFGFIWWALPDGRASLKARVGLLQVLANFVGVTAAMKAVRTLQDGEGACVRRERAAGALRLPAYFVGKVLAELPVTLMLPALLVCVTHPMAKLACPLPALAMLLALEALAASALGLFAGAAAPSLDVGLELTKALTTLSTVFGGLYFDVSTLPWLLRWVPRASIVRVAWDGMVTSELTALATGLGEHDKRGRFTGGKASLVSTLLGEQGVEGGRWAVAELVGMAALFSLAAFCALAARAPRFQAVKGGRGAEGKPKVQ